MTNSLGLVAEEVALASWARTIKRSALQELLAVAARPGVLSFALGLPAAEIFPVASYERAMLRALRETNKALQYGPPLGALKRQIVELMKRRGVSCREEQVFLTTGAQQGVNLLAHLLLNPGGQVLTEEFIYPGFQQVLNIFEPEVLSVPTDLETGIDVDAVEARLAQAAPRRPAFIYAITEGHNPLGVSMSPEKRQRLVELARRYRVPIVEDDPYGLVCYEGETLVPPMRALYEQWVLYVGSFSNILIPPLLVGLVVLTESLIPMLSIIKESIDIDTRTFALRPVSGFMDDGHLPWRMGRL